MQPIQFTVTTEFDETSIKAIRGKIVYVTRNNIIQAIDIDEEPEATEETLLTMPTYVFEQLKEFLVPTPEGVVDFNNYSSEEKDLIYRWLKYLK